MTSKSLQDKLRHKRIQTILIILLVFWLGISIIRTGVNFTKFFSDEISWVSYSEDQKKQILYGDIYPISRYIKFHFPTAHTILVVSPDGKPYLLLRYLLYPQKVTWDKLITSNTEIDKYSFIVLYHPNDAIKDYSPNLLNTLETKKKTYEIKEKNILVAKVYKKK